MDEDQRLAGRRALQGRPARLRRLRALLRALRPGLPARRRADRRGHAAERAPEPQPERLSGHGPARRRGGAPGRRRRAARCDRAGLHTKILGYDHNWSLHPNDVGPPDDPANPEYAASLLSNPAARHTSRAPRSTATPATPSASPSLHDAFPPEGHLLHRVLGLAVGRPGDHVPRHPALAHALPDRRRGAQLGQDRHHVEPRARPVRRPAQRRLRHVLRRRDDRSRRRAARRRRPTTTCSGT